MHAHPCSSWHLAVAALPLSLWNCLWPPQDVAEYSGALFLFGQSSGAVILLQPVLANARPLHCTNGGYLRTQHDLPAFPLRTYPTEIPASEVHFPGVPMTVKTNRGSGA